MKFPKIKVYAHVLNYVTICALTIMPAYLYVKYFGLSEEQKIEKLIEKYPVDYKIQRDHRADLQVFFDKMKNGEQDDTFSKILKGGKTEEKRRHVYVHPSKNKIDDSKLE